MGVSTVEPFKAKMCQLSIVSTDSLCYNDRIRWILLSVYVCHPLNIKEQSYCTTAVLMCSPTQGRISSHNMRLTDVLSLSYLFKKNKKIGRCAHGSSSIWQALSLYFDKKASQVHSYEKWTVYLSLCHHQLIILSF